MLTLTSTPGFDVKTTFYRLASGKYLCSPFGDYMVRDARAAVLERLRLQGATGDLHTAPPGQPYLLHAVGEYARLTEDPDNRIVHRSTHSFCKGIRNGANSFLHRTPAVFERKVKWRKYDQEEMTEAWMSNHRVVTDNADAIVAKFADEVRLGRVYTLTKQAAKDKFGDKLRVAAVLAEQKSSGAWRLLHDATHGVAVNPQITVRDQHAVPSIAEKRVVMSRLRPKSVLRLGCKGDVEDAHRTYLVSPLDHGSQACCIGDVVYVNAVGTQGLGSAAYWFARLFGVFCRLCYYSFPDAPLWIFLYADDLDVVGTGPDAMLQILAVYLLLEIFCVPMSWKKSEGGIAYNWIGYYQDWQRFQLGLSESRATWLAKWLEERLEADKVHPHELSEVLGRMGFAAIAIDIVRPFLGPIYAWTAAVPHTTRIRLPIMSQLLFKFLVKIFRDPALYLIEAWEPSPSPVLHYLGDAQASATSIGIGGWQASEELHLAKWFSTDLTTKTAPWAFRHGEQETFRSIASLELFTTLLCLKVLPPPVKCGNARLQLTAGTDNLGNAYALTRWSTTRFPLGLIMMELAVEARLKNLSLELVWVPRDQNVPADDLSNGLFHKFDIKNRIDVDVAGMHFHVLNDLLEAADELFMDVESRKQLSKKTATLRSKDEVQATKMAKRLKTTRLKATNPW